MQYRIAIVRFRRDLHLSDRPALNRACPDAERILPLFILDRAFCAAPGAGGPIHVFVLGLLQELREPLSDRGSGRVLQSGDPRQVLPALVAESGADAVYFNREYAAAGRHRDGAVASILSEHGTAHQV
jgi:deoxyribodipyrimidine photo-lyase